MKKMIKNIFIVAIAFFALQACEMSLYDVIEPANFKVTVSKFETIDPATGAIIINANDTVFFNFGSEKVDNIIFYSGEPSQEFRFRDRWVADTTSNLVPEISLTSRFTSIDNAILKSYSLRFTSNLKAYTENAVDTATWTNCPLQSSALQSGTVPTEKVNFVNTPTIPGTLTVNIADWYKQDEYALCVRSRSNKAMSNRLKLESFTWRNTETRDYSYIDEAGNPVPISYKVKYKLIDSLTMSTYNNFQPVDAPYAASFCAYSPDSTYKVGDETTRVANSQWYAWQAPELGLKYGQGSGYPYVKGNKYGRAAVRQYYPVEVISPDSKVPQDDGSIGIVPTTAMTLETVDAMLISQKRKTRLVAPDQPTSIVKTKIVSMPQNYSVVYAKPGLYVATFYVFNQDINNTKSIIKQIKFLVK